MITTLSNLQRKLSADLPPHLSVVGAVLALGLTARSMSHIVATLADGSIGRNPRLDNHDLTAQTPVVALRDHPSTDLSARLLAVAVGLVGLWMFYRLAAPISGDMVSIGVIGFVAINAAVCLGDPLWFAISKLRGGL